MDFTNAQGVEFRPTVISLDAPLVLSNSKDKKVIFNGTISAKDNLMNKNSLFQIITLVEHSGAGTGQFEIAFNDIVIVKRAVITTSSTSTQEQWETLMFNTNSLNDQIRTTVFGTTKDNFAFYKFDTTKDIKVTIAIQNTSVSGISKIHLFNIWKFF